MPTAVFYYPLEKFPVELADCRLGKLGERDRGEMQLTRSGSSIFT